MTNAPAGETSGPLKGVTVLEMAGLGPAPLAGLMLAELGARVVRVERISEKSFLGLPDDVDYNRHGREILKVDLKSEAGRELVLRLVEKSDILLEGFRPGVMERLGIGPESALLRNPRLIYGRITGFGQSGPLADRAGHDLTYIAYTGILHAIGVKGARPTAPLNLVADYGGGTMFLLLGVLAALIERGVSGKGQIVDAAMMDGASMLALPLFAYMAGGLWKDERAANLLDTGAPFYDTYETADGRHIAIACLEPQFFAEFAQLLPLEPTFVKRQYDQTCWDDMREAIATRVSERSRDDWADLFVQTDACVAPVLSFAEARAYPHNRQRASYVSVGRMERPAPAPRLSRTALQVAGQQTGGGALTLLSDLGILDAAQLVSDGVAA